MSETLPLPALLERLERDGLTLVARSGTLAVRPASAITAWHREVIAARRQELLDWIVGTAQEALMPAANIPDAPWDAQKGQTVLGDVLTLLDRAVFDFAVRDVRFQVLTLYREMVLDHHGQRSPLLWEDLEVIEALVARWRRADVEALERAREEADRCRQTMEGSTCVSQPVEE
jgi:hypothetical protein